MWENYGVAPAYEPWTITYVVKSDGLPTQLISADYHLINIMPGDVASAGDLIKIPSTEHGRTYTVSLRIVDPAGYRPPMPLAQAGPDGDMLVATITF